jgi:hypothetical protein
MKPSVSIALQGSVICSVLLLGAAVSGQIPLPVVEGYALPPTGVFTSKVFDLRQADEGQWFALDPDGDGAEDGVFDPNLRLVIYKFTDLEFPPPTAGTETYTFINHYTTCPVVFIVEGDFELPAGVVLSLDGEGDVPDAAWSGALSDYGEPGPGGFRGGHSRHFTAGGPGFGPGGGHQGQFPAAGFSTNWHGTSLYISSTGIPLIGGSGGTGTQWGVDAEDHHGAGGGGGGAVLIAVRNSAILNGKISARGGGPGIRWYSGPGSGGCIRLVADSLSGSGTIDVRGGTHDIFSPVTPLSDGGEGYIRIEVSPPNPIPGSLALLGQNTTGTPVVSGTALKLWPDATDPTIRIRSVLGSPLPSGLYTGSIGAPDFILIAQSALSVVIETSGVDPLSAVTLRVTPELATCNCAIGGVQISSASHIMTEGDTEVWQASITPAPTGLSVLQAITDLAVSAEASILAEPQSEGLPAWTPVTPLLDYGIAINSIALGDVDEDGNTDLVTASSTIGGNSGIAVMLGLGMGDFGPIAGTFSIGSDPVDMRLEDLNDDGHLDIVALAQGAGQVCVLLGAGDGSFGPFVGTPVGPGPRTIDLGDVDNDGDVDVACGCTSLTAPYTSSIHILVNNGQGVFTTYQTFSVADAADVALGDLDGDGDLDLALAELEDSHVSFHENMDGLGYFELRSVNTEVSLPSALDLGDWDSDGRLDCVIQWDIGDAEVHRNIGMWEFVPYSGCSTRGNAREVRMVDISLDGQLDLIVSDWDGVSYLVSDSTGAINSSGGVHFDLLNYGAVIADVNGDCWADLVVRFQPGNTLIGIAIGVSPPAATFVDCNLDGIYDGCQLATEDQNDDGIIDICASQLVRFIRGDANLDAVVDLADVISIISYLFGGAPSTCGSALDADDSEQITLADAFLVICTLFDCGGGAQIPAPYPVCGVDPVPGGLGCVTGPVACP